MRLPNGFGSVYFLGRKRRRPWIARVTTDWEIVDGKLKQKYKTIGYFVEKSEALDALISARISPVPEKINITLGELYEEWSKAKYEYISKQTADCYKAGWKRLLRFKNVKFSELRSSHIQSVIDSCHKEGMSRSSLEKIKIVGTMLYGYAMQNDIVNKNYAEFVSLPKTVKQEKERFSTIEIQKIENSLGLPWIDSILVLIYTGFRINEMLNLTMFNVDLDGMVIRGGLKTDAGKDREIPIHPKIYPIIKAMKEVQGERLVSLNGIHINDKYYREKLYYPALKAIGVRELNPHCCRHTFASMLSDKGADPKLIQKLLGHAKYQFTEDTYVHKDTAALRTAINLI